MRRTRILCVLTTVLLGLLVFVPGALAITHAGQGLYGETNDVVITNAMFGLIVLFPVLIVVFSLLQGWLDHRKHERIDAAKRRAASVDWRGGW
jgi:hypothetical protein